MTLSLTIPAIPHGTNAPKTQEFWGNDGFSFSDILDAINPLQQIPGISTIYRETTGEAVSAGARLIGGALLGGPIGLALAFVNVAIENNSGRDIGGHLAHMFDTETPTTQLASNEPAVELGAPSPVNRSAYEAYRKMSLLA